MMYCYRLTWYWRHWFYAWTI